MKKSSEKFRQMQRDRILKMKPWLKSTGPTTNEGKEKSKMNALKTHPELHKLLKETVQLMKQKKELFNSINNKYIVNKEV